MPVAVYLTGNVFGTETWALPKSINMLVITVGVAIASVGELKFDWVGFSFQMASIVCESTRLTLIQILLQRQGIKMNPIHTLYYVAPACFVFLCIPFWFVESNKVLALGMANLPTLTLLLNAACAFGKLGGGRCVVGGKAVVQVAIAACVHC